MYLDLSSHGIPVVLDPLRQCSPPWEYRDNMGITGYILGLYGDHGKEHRKYYHALYRDYNKLKAVHWEELCSGPCIILALQACEVLFPAGPNGIRSVAVGRCLCRSVQIRALPGSADAGTSLHTDKQLRSFFLVPVLYALRY